MKKILIIRFSSIGDIVLTSPVVRCVKSQMEGVEVHYLTKSSFAEIVSANPFVDKVYTFKKNTSEVLKSLRNEKYDLIIDLHNNLRSSQVKIALNCTAVSFSKLNIRKWLNVNFKLNVLPAEHIVDRYLKTVKSFGIKNDLKGLDFFINSSDEKFPNDFPFNINDSYYALVAGAKHFTKRLPDKKLVEIIEQMASPVVILGGKEDVATGNFLQEKFPHFVYNACGKTNLGQSAFLIKNAKAVLSNDTGLMHIAAAFKKKTISVWGNTIPAFGMFPYLPGEGSLIVENNNLSCRPCSKIGFDKCPKKHFKCMQDLPVKKIAEALR